MAIGHDAVARGRLHALVQTAQFSFKTQNRILRADQIVHPVHCHGYIFSWISQLFPPPGHRGEVPGTSGSISVWLHWCMEPSNMEASYPRYFAMKYVCEACNPTSQYVTSFCPGLMPLEAKSARNLSGGSSVGSLVPLTVVSSQNTCDAPEMWPSL